MRRLLSLIARHYTHFYRVITIGTLLSSHHYITTCNSPVTCSSFNNLFGQAISVIDSRIIKIECNGDLIGYAYCFMDGFLVTSRYICNYVVWSKWMQDRLEIHINFMREIISC